MIAFNHLVSVIIYLVSFLFFLSFPENLVIDFGEEDEDDVPEEAKHLILCLMQYHPMYRLGASTQGGVAAVKEHPFFFELKWRELLIQKAEFIPQLQGEEDTSYFDREYCLFLPSPLSLFPLSPP